MLPIPRTRLRDQVVRQLEQLIASGELGELERLKEVSLARRLAVSRTPLREALLLLEREGLVVSEPNKGFRVAARSEARVREIYPMLGALESLAVREGGEVLQARVPELRAINGKLPSRRSRSAQHGLDRRFHEALWSGAANRTLVDTLRRLWVEAQRYDGATERGLAAPERSSHDHAQIIDSIEAGRFERAGRLVEAHWRTGIEIVVGWLRRQPKPSSVVLVLALAIAPAAAACQSAPAPKPAAAPAFPDDPWGYFIGEAQVGTYLQRLSLEHRPRTLAFRGIAVVAPTGDDVVPDQTVVVDGGTIRAIGDSARVVIPADAEVVDGRGRFLIPGLVDMHVHTNFSDAQYLLDLVNGVTTVREMNGSPSLLRQREQARANELLIPNLFVAGPILATHPMGRYATVVPTPEAARREVRAQHAAGYDAIKVHNIVAPEVYDAICDEARTLKRDVVGHIPHAISIARAVTCQRTFEHFKGYIDDRTLTLTDEDYVAATRGHDVWNVPTFYESARSHLRGASAKQLVREAPEMRYVAERDRAAWLASADEPVKPAQLRILPLSETIFGALRVAGARFAAGTDSGGGYPFHVRGFALHDELRRMQALGMSGLDVLRAATLEPARAMRRDAEVGTIAVGKRADLVVLRADPRTGVGALATIDGVVVRGIWLSRRTLDGVLDELAQLAIAHPRTRAELERALETLETLQANGYVLRPHVLGWLRHHLERAGLPVTRSLFQGVVALPPES